MAVSPEKKQRLSAYLDPDLKRRLADFADRREQSASLIAEAAIASFLSPDANEGRKLQLASGLIGSIATFSAWSEIWKSPTKHLHCLFALG